MPARLLSGKWAVFASRAIIPPSPQYIYTIHAVFDEIGEKRYIGCIRTAFTVAEQLNWK